MLFPALSAPYPIPIYNLNPSHIPTAMFSLKFLPMLDLSNYMTPHLYKLIEFPIEFPIPRSPTHTHLLSAIPEPIPLG